MTWFETLMGFPEHTPAQVRENIELDGEFLVSKENHRRIRYGRLEVAQLATLEAGAEKVAAAKHGQLRLSECVGDVGALHRDPENIGALFQAASQFNLLEMASPNMIPEQGVGIYEHDRTQGPVCAIACGGGTIYRNYFVPLNGRVGQTAEHQVDCLADIGAALDGHGGSVWQLQNGYAFANQASLERLNTIIGQMAEHDLSKLRRFLRIGLQWDAEVTTAKHGGAVSQAYCSALPLGYSAVPKYVWEPFARLILEATYEATMAAGVMNAARTGNNRIYLTLVGGGVFANPMEWVFEAIAKAAKAYAAYDLDCQIVSFGQSDPKVVDFVKRWTGE